MISNLRGKSCMATHANGNGLDRIGHIGSVSLRIRLGSRADRFRATAIRSVWRKPELPGPLLIETNGVQLTDWVNGSGVKMKNVKAFLAHALLTGCVLVAWAPASQAQVSTSNAERKPGLAVCYMYKFIRHVDEIAEWEKHIKCEPGAPLAMLNFDGGTGKVLTSTSDDGVLARITGYIHLAKVGAYKFAFESNDGVRLKVDGKMIVEDPGVHDDQFSELATLEVTKPGWYPLSIDFFERRVTWTLRFLWKPAGVDGDLAPVPAEALTH